jgi:hypothetical protein
MFLTRLELADEARADYWRVVSPLIWTDPIYGRLVVPAGFETDLASIPRLFRNLPAFDPNGASRRPAVVHDWLYSSKAGYRYGRDFADSFLRASLLAEGASPLTAAAFYYAVRVGGRSHWDPLPLRQP